MSLVAVFGAGDLGGAVAHAIASLGCTSRVLLIDSLGQVAAGKALDIQQMGAISAFSTRLEGTTDPTRAIGCDVCVVADRAGQPASEWRLDGLEAVARLARDVGHAPIVLAGSSQGTLLRSLGTEVGIASRRLIGSAPEALRAAVRAMVAIEAGCAAGEVALSVVGHAPESIVVPWAEASIGGFAIEKTLTQAQLARVEARVKGLWPPGPYALGLAAAQAVDALVRSSRRPLCISALLTGEFGARGAVGTVPALLGPDGIVRSLVPELNARERVQVETALLG